jgi:hypothetical protein
VKLLLLETMGKQLTPQEKSNQITAIKTRTGDQTAGTPC